MPNLMSSIVQSRSITEKLSWKYLKTKDLDKVQKEKITVAFIADSIASGLVMKEVITRINERFTFIEHIEVVSPLTYDSWSMQAGQSRWQ